jgi:hypothetical protein
MLSTRLCAALALSLLFSAAASARPEEAQPPLPADASLHQRIWHDVASGSQVCGEESYATCAGEALALLGPETRLEVYTRVLSERPVSEDGSDCIEQIEAAVGSSASESAEMIEEVTSWRWEYVALRSERAALRGSLRAELLRASVLLEQLGAPEGEAIQQRMGLLRDEIAEYRTLLEEPLVVGVGSGRVPDSREALDQLDGHIQGLSALAFELRGVEAALRDAVPQS